jgi:hypothetical protein
VLKNEITLNEIAIAYNIIPNKLRNWNQLVQLHKKILEKIGKYIQRQGKETNKISFFQVFNYDLKMGR